MNKKNTLSKVLAGGMAAALLTGSFAYFTDYVHTSANVTAGTVAVKQTNDWVNTLKDGPQDLNNLNPGDSRSLKFSVQNTGNKAIDVRHTIKLSVVDAAGNAKAMSEGFDWNTKAAGSSAAADVKMLQFEVFKASDVVKTSNENGNAGYELKVGAVPLFSTDSLNDTTKMGAKRVIDETNGTVTYYFADSTLNGVGANAENDNYAKAEQVATTLDDTKDVLIKNTAETGDTVEYDYVLIFRDTTLNDFQGCTVFAEMVVEAKQHLNTNSSWQNIETIEHVLKVSGKATQDTTINVAPQDTTGVLEDVNATGAEQYNAKTEVDTITVKP